jgi:hypothetical protein
VLLADLQNSATIPDRRESGRQPGNGISSFGGISADDASWPSRASRRTLWPATRTVGGLFLRDVQAGSTERVSVDSAGVQANGDCSGGAVSADGRFVAFSGLATNIVAGDTNASRTCSYVIGRAARRRASA